jgi:N-carbamoyl-L-amino-acid hydrolase
VARAARRRRHDDARRDGGRGLRADGIDAIRRDPARYLGFVEVHIEQGPVLAELDLPLGVVTSINGSLRWFGEVAGMASHAGTTPMDRRRDAAAAVAELILYAERRASQAPDVVATVGILEVPAGSVNVVPGRCRFSLDVRATTDAARDACAADVLAELGRICERRGVSHAIEETMRAAAAPSDPALAGALGTRGRLAGRAGAPDAERRRPRRDELHGA